MSPELRSVLIVDDNAAFRAFVRTLFARAGYETIEAAGGKEALIAVQAERPALVILDVLLPDVSGFEICRELRDEFGDELPIIFVSGERAEAADRAVGLLIGADDYIVKPFDPDEFLARARRSIIRQQPDRRHPTTPPSIDLTNRESEVLRLLADGQAPTDIATELVISPKTVASHIQRILAKLGVHSRAQAVAVAYKADLFKDWAATEENGATPLRSQTPD
jgi:two-component system nitrate/nitrite response regulator NarL